MRFVGFNDVAGTAEPVVSTMQLGKISQTARLRARRIVERDSPQ
jgi:hypothetical protein